MTRQESIDNFTKQVLGTLASDCSDIETIGTNDESNVEFQWWEIRESIVRCLFELDHEQTRGEIHAKYVRENCL